MSRKRNGIIRETQSELRELLRLHHASEFEPRLRMLALLASDQTVTLAETAARIGCSERSVRRWWSQYQQAGLDALLRDATVEEPLVRYDGRRRSGSPVAIDPRLLRFLSKLPTSYESVAWIRSFRNALVEMLHDVDHAMVAIDVLSNNRKQRAQKTQVLVMQHSPGGKGQKDLVTSQPWIGTPGEMLFEDAVRNGFPAEIYGKPIILDYHSTETKYLGTIVLFRKLGSPNISRHTLALVESLRPFFTFLFTDCVVRHTLLHPSHSTFTDTISAMVKEYNLTRREGEVLMHQVLGRSYEEIAQIMDISPNTVHRYIVAIHKRTGARNLTELFAHSITPAQGHSIIPQELEHLPIK